MREVPFEGTLPLDLEIIKDSLDLFEQGRDRQPLSFASTGCTPDFLSATLSNFSQKLDLYEEATVSPLRKRIHTLQLETPKGKWKNESTLPALYQRMGWAPLDPAPLSVRFIRGITGRAYFPQYTSSRPRVLYTNDYLRVSQSSVLISDRETQIVVKQAVLSSLLKEEVTLPPQHPHLLRRPLHFLFNSRQELSHLILHSEGSPLNRLSLEEIKSLGKKIASAVECLHDHGILHCDIKKMNVVGDKLIDFGLSRRYYPYQEDETPRGPFSSKAFLFLLNKVFYHPPEAACKKKHSEMERAHFLYTVSELLWGRDFSNTTLQEFFQNPQRVPPQLTTAFEALPSSLEEFKSFFSGPLDEAVNVYPFHKKLFGHFYPEKKFDEAEPLIEKSSSGVEEFRDQVLTFWTEETSLTDSAEEKTKLQALKALINHKRLIDPYFDSYSLGHMLYWLYVESTPYFSRAFGQRLEEWDGLFTDQSITEEEYHQKLFSLPCFKIPNPAVASLKDLVSKTIRYLPHNRLSMRQIQEHPFLK